MDIYGLLGKNIKHSKSPEFFNNRFKKHGIDAEYHLYDLNNIDEIESLIKNTPNLKGLNVTIPYKRALSFLVDECSADVKYSGSLNLLSFSSKNGRLVRGYNTDVDAFENTIKKFIKDNNGIRALILGTGGVAHTVSYVFRKLGVFYYFVTRDPSKVAHIGYNWINKEVCDNFNLIVNCTPVGMSPNDDELVDLPYHLLNEKHICYDCIYNPEETMFLKHAKEHGAQVIGGLPMFNLQAEHSWKIWMR